MKKLGFGCMRFPLLNSEDQASFDTEKIIKMVDTFLERGFTYFDTAYLYHNYQSENIVKKVLVERHPRESFMLATKLPTMLLKKAEDIPRIFSEQLEKTGAGYFDYYLIHTLNTDLYRVAEELGAFDFVMEMKAQGKIKKIGFSFHDKADVLDKILTEHPEMEFVQLQINYLDWDNPDVQSRECYEVALKHNKEILIMEPVKGGTLAQVPHKARELLTAENPNFSIASWAIRFAAGLKNVSIVLSGMSNMEQLLDNTDYMKDFTPLNEEEVKLCFKVADIIKSTVTIPCTACRYCVDECPMGIAIPEYFCAYNEYVKGNEAKAVAEYQQLCETHSKPLSCIGCKKCEMQCPQHIKIATELKKVNNLF